MTVIGLHKKPQATVEESPQPEPPPWDVQYTAEMDDGTKHSWVKTYTWQPRAGKHEAAGNALLSMKYGNYSQIFEGVLYPPHRLRQVTWEIL